MFVALTQKVKETWLSVSNETMSSYRYLLMVTKFQINTYSIALKNTSGVSFSVHTLYNCLWQDTSCTFLNAYNLLAETNKDLLLSSLLFLLRGDFRK